jgi:hypothetical protein
MFDMSMVPLSVLDMNREQISTWRKNGGQLWGSENLLEFASEREDIPLAPRIGVWGDKAYDGTALPQDLHYMYDWLNDVLPKSYAQLDESGKRRGEGVVIRSTDRKTIAKARFQDYERTFRKLAQGK